jgi:hypothetical protein
MGRFGSGELVTIGLGVVAPLVLFSLQLALVLWNRRLMRAGKGRPAAVGFYAGVLSLVVPLLGVLGTVILMSAAFDDVSRAPASDRAAVLAGNISEAMNLTALGVVAGSAAFLISLGCAIYAHRWGVAPLPGRGAGDVDRSA